MRVSSRRVAVVCFAVLAGGCSAGDGQPSEADEPAAGSGGSESGTAGANNDVGQAGSAGSVLGSGGSGSTVSGAGGTGGMKSQSTGGMGGNKAGGAGSSGSGGAPVVGGKAGKCDWVRRMAARPRSRRPVSHQACGRTSRLRRWT